MTRLTTTTALLLALAAPALAQTEGAGIDANGDGLLSVTEVQAVFPDITAEQFTAMDLNADGALDQAELDAATEAGMMPATTQDG